MKFNTILELMKYIKPKEIFRIRDIDSLESFVTQIEGKIRSSMEYRIWIHNIKHIKKDQTCRILDIDTSELEYTKVEIHHVIFLWYIVMINGMYLLNNLEEDDYITMYDVVESVLEDHLDDIIPYTPMTPTMHSLYHDGLRDIKIDDIQGDYDKYISKYLKEIKQMDIVKEHIEKVFKKTL